MELTQRLKAVAKMIPKCNTIADIGTDHAYIPIYAVKNGISSYAIACDVNEGPLKIAEKNIKNHLLDDKIITRLSNGLDKLELNEADTIVIAGMGGQLISEIILNDINKITEKTTLVLQPMIAQSDLRRFLFKNNFSIVDERLAREGNKIYNIIKTVKTPQKFDDIDIYVGRKLLTDELFEIYAEKNIRISKNIIQGLEKSEGKEKEISYEKHIISLFENALSERR